MQITMKHLLIVATFFVCSVRLATAQRPSKTRPNIIFILADDLGWNDVGFHGSNQIPTPNIDALAYSGTILHNYYTQPLCTPSRSALLTGRHPINNGMQVGVIYNEQPWGLPLTEKLLPEYLHELGYVNRAVGKWHLGYFKKVYTPTFRGFDSHFGYWLGHIHYFSHEIGEEKGYDFRENMNVSWNTKGTYVTRLINQRAVEIIGKHNKRKPLFLYIAHHATHAPLEAPQELVDNFKHIKNKKRRIFAAMLTAMDHSVGKVMAALKAKGMLDNSIIVFTSDNGGATNGYDGNVASNWPLRGGKDTLWEGGVRVPAFIWSPLLSTAMPIHFGLMSVMDWLPTLLSAVNGTFVPSKYRYIDGENQWKTLLQDDPPPYDTLLHNMYGNTKALRKGKWKIIRGSFDDTYSKWYGEEQTDQPYKLNSVKNSLAARAIKHTRKPLPTIKTILKTRKQTVIKCLTKNKRGNQCRPNIKPCLFDVSEDPCEQNNLAEERPKLIIALQHLLDTSYHPVRPNNKHSDPTSNPKYWNRTWCNWKDYPSPKLTVNRW